MTRRILSLLLPSILLWTMACDDGPADGDGDADADSDADGDGTLHVEEVPGCNPLIPENCAFPFPSMAHLVEDSETATGWRAAITEVVLPERASAPDVFVTRYNEADGFSIATPFIALFPETLLDRESLPHVTDLAPSVESTSAVQVFNRETGERIPVWAELDPHTDDPAEQSLIIRPMTGLPFGRRVAIVVTDALQTLDGGTPAAPAAFAALRDGLPTDSDTIESWREDYDSLFEFLESHDVPRDRVLLAWEAVTFSREFATNPMREMVEGAVALIEEVTPPTYRVTRCVSHDAEDHATFGCDESDEANPLSDLTWRRLYGTVDLPNYLGDEGYIRIGDEGRPEPLGTLEAEFVVNVPASLRLAPAGTAPIVVFGHGLLVNPQTYLADDLDRNGQMALADRLGAVFIGTRWTGLSDTELLDATNVIFDFGNSFTFSATLAQGILNQLLMPPFAANVLIDEPLLQSPDGAGSVMDVSHIYYTGISQGGIFGTTFMALSPHVRTGALHVPGAGYVHMVSHSVDFVLFQSFLDGAFSDPREQQVFFALAQRLFDVGDPINYIDFIVDEPVTPLGHKNCLWQCVVGDSQAMWYGCDMLMRAGGFPIAGPPTAPIFGLDVIETPTAANTSAMQQFDPGFGLPALDVDMPEETGAHTAVRRNDEVHLQVIDFFDSDLQGRVVNHCGGPCNIDPVPEPE